MSGIQVFHKISQMLLHLIKVCEITENQVNFKIKQIKLLKYGYMHKYRPSWEQILTIN